LACVFELVVGTTDSARLRGRGNTISQHTREVTPASPRSQTLTFELDRPQEDVIEGPGMESSYSHNEHDHQHPEHPYTPQEDGYDQYQDYHQDHTLMQESPCYPSVSVPAPEVPAEEELTEKERIRRAEERLLPSQPPQGGDASPPGALVPSAPEDPDDLYGGQDAATPRATHVSRPVTEASSHTEMASYSLPAPLAPMLEDLSPQHAHEAAAGEDKQELERRRLMAEASSPSDFPNEDDNAGEGGSGAQCEPTAPTLTEEDEHRGHYSNHTLPGGSFHVETLPRYER